MTTIADWLSSSGKYPLRATTWPPSADVLANAGAFVRALNALLTAFGASRKLTSGYRSRDVNRGIPDAKLGDAHETGEGGDLEDADGRLAAFCLKHLELLEQLGLYLEDPGATQGNGHVHLQTRAPKSGNRVFKP